eukprot:CAMPEP_0176440386 /NCGR_PEP_ID=MMETSP0127-20121128/20539_1 /TAXON_ID=938130 /ORGANISM="Platyophrya macrostoma, Strain WH" /LENGTH=770 /DNA_ID=CAMNT_0017824899 /DNA_START=38 /DNA_END=2350 /DNA_ORIENTATION=+
MADQQELKFPLMRPEKTENELQAFGGGYPQGGYNSPQGVVFGTKNSIQGDDLLDLQRSKDVPYNIFDYMRYKSKIIPPFPSVKEWGQQENLKKNLVNDLFAGITITTIVCTEGLAIAMMGGLQPHYALYTAALPTLAYALFGSSKNLAVGPASVVGILLGSMVQDIPEEDRPNAAAFISLWQGLFMLAMGYMKLGFIEYILSLPALKGFIAGIIVRIMIEQFQNIVSFKSHAHESIEKIEDIIHHSDQWNYAGCVIGLCTMAFLAVLLITKTITHSKHMVFAIGPLFTNVIGSIIVNMLDLPAKYGIRLVKDLEPEIPYGLEFSNPFKNFFEYSDKFMTPIIVMGIVGFIETIAIAKEVAGRKGYKIDATNEFKAFGVSNLVAAFANSMPCFGSLARTPISVSAGSESQLCCAITGVGVVFVLYLFIFLIKQIPLCIVGATIFFCVSKQVKLLKLAFLCRYFPFPDAFIMALSMLVTIIIDPEIGAGTTVFFSLLIILKRGTTPFVHLEHYDKVLPIRQVSTQVSSSNPLGGAVNTFEYSTLHFTVERDTNPNLKYEAYKSYKRPDGANMQDWERGKYKDFCMCVDLDCPQKYHILVITLPHYFFYVNSHSLKIYLDTLHHCTPKMRDQAASAPALAEGQHQPQHPQPTQDENGEPVVPEPTKTINAVLIDCHLTRYFDYTGSLALAEVCEEFDKLGVAMGIAELDMAHTAKLKATGLRSQYAKYSNKDSVEIMEKLMEKVLTKRLVGHQDSNMDKSAKSNVLQKEDLLD